MMNRTCKVILCIFASCSCIYGDTPYDGAPFETSAKAIQETNRLQNEVIFHEFGIDHTCHYEKWAYWRTKIQDKNFEACRKIRQHVDQDTSNGRTPNNREDEAEKRMN